MPRGENGTRDRLLAAASELFAAKGFHATTVREIADRARVNLASGHYHYGSKRALYLEVLRAQFADIRDRLRRRGASRDERELDGLGRAELLALLEARVQVMLEILIGPNAGAAGMLMQREMTDPSEALPVIVDEFIEPMKREMEAIVSRLVPALDRGAVEHSVFSIVGQAHFFHLAKPVILKMLKRTRYPRGFPPRLAKHIATFSAGGMERIAAGQEKRGRHA
ncbi:MAG: TetR/AcrR family transcriptional regulator, regulator of cefoperazone and chloramphenicol [Candidatus Binatota bacterium]|nr:TetR/AcrR family transcriptional regulator, regulator of cefoperazone and chloramphenicol [Candidatus Binatota bacterium]